MKVSRVGNMRYMDRFAVEKLDIPEEILMENAGLASAFVLEQEIGIQNKKFVVFCGVGNNGGDGLVVARKIHSNGGSVRVFIVGDPEKFKGAAKTNWNVILKLPVEVSIIKSTEEARKDVIHCHTIVDALFGTGFDREATGLYKEVIQLINESSKVVLSLDIPSGVHGDTGEIMGVAVKADYTVTFGLPKVGNMLYPGYHLCGKLYVSHISFPPSLHKRERCLQGKYGRGTFHCRRSILFWRAVFFRLVLPQGRRRVRPFGRARIHNTIHCRERKRDRVCSPEGNKNRQHFHR
jgi:hydroxyethylthiazole kinase-like uncharacterized protein yjeF